VAVGFDSVASELGALEAGGALTIAWWSGALGEARARLHVAAEPGAWRRLPLPVADSLFAPVELVPVPRPLFMGAVEPGREWVVEQSRFHNRLLREPGVPPIERLRELLAETAIGVNVHASGAFEFEQRVPLHLAAGQLLISETLAPDHGLVAGVDYVWVDNVREFELVLWDAQRHPEAYLWLRRRGRLKAERFRASRVYGRLLADALRTMAEPAARS
jgi:hypothetical protein